MTSIVSFLHTFHIFSYFTKNMTFTMQKKKHFQSNVIYNIRILNFFKHSKLAPARTNEIFYKLSVYKKIIYLFEIIEQLLSTKSDHKNNNK